MLRTVCFIAIFLLSSGVASSADSMAAKSANGQMLGNTCAGCHGTYGKSVGSAPSLIGIPVPLFVEAMQAFKSGERGASVMDRIARGYSDDDFQKMAEFFAEQ